MKLCMPAWLLLCLLAGGGGLLAQAPFPAGLDGELYFCPRIDLVPAAEGGPYKVTLDGILNEPVWQRAAYHTVVTFLDTSPVEPEIDPPSDDWNMIFAACADNDYLYVAWKVVDDTLINTESHYCDVWKDDSIEVYLDALNNGPNCTTAASSCYAADDAQFTIGADMIGREPGNPDQPTCPEGTPVEECLEIGGVTASANCDFNGQPWPTLVRGVVGELQSGDIANNTFGEGKTGWQGEIAIALSTLGTNDDGPLTYEISPDHGTCIGFSIQGNDDDRADVADRDHKLAWAKRETAESAWRNPGVFGKLSFVDPTKVASQGACALPVERLTCSRNVDGTVLVTWRNPGTADANVDTKVFVDDVEKATVPGSAAQVVLAKADVPEDGLDHIIAVKNNSDEAAPTCVLIQNPFTECGGIRFWNILCGFTRDGGANPGDELIRADYMTDGVTGELDFIWKPGATIQTDFDGAAASHRILRAIGAPARNPAGVPTVFDWKDVDDRVNFRDMVRADWNDVMGYAQCYVINETGSPIDVYLGISSDDSVQVYLNGQEVWIHDIPRGGSSACTPQDIAPDGVLFQDVNVLEPGENNLLLKVFDGTGDWELSLRFQDELQNPITDGLSISLTPSDKPKENCTNGIDDDGDTKADCADSDCAAEPSCLVTMFHRGDSDDNGKLELTDAIRILGFLFLGGAVPPCMDAADADDNGKLELTDAVRILGFLFLGGAAPAPPGPPSEACAADPTPGDAGEDLGCESYTKC